MPWAHRAYVAGRLKNRAEQDVSVLPPVSFSCTSASISLSSLHASLKHAEEVTHQLHCMLRRLAHHDDLDTESAALQYVRHIRP